MTLFLKFPNPRLSLSSKNLILKQGMPWVVFEQHFFSESLKSQGTKEVRVVWENGTWKIDKEKFYAKKNKVTGLDDSLHRKKKLSENKFPFVIHVSSHSNKPEAIFASNNLKENGYDSYTAPVRVSKDVQIYRVYIGRFANWDQAHRVVQTLRRKRLARHATAIPYPFTLRVGEVDSIVKARELIEKLRLKEVSSFLSVSSGEPEGIKFEVFVGAFKKLDNAIWLMKDL
jgi:cell division septation protein DedD